jgi:hypothetical protein
MALVFHKNMSVIPAKLLTYYAAPEFSNGGIGRNRKTGFLKSLLMLAVVLFLGRLAFLHVLPVASALLTRLTSDGGYQQGYRTPSRYPARQHWQPQPMYWQLPSGEWLYLY